MKDQSKNLTSSSPVSSNRWKSYLATGAAVAAGSSGAQGVIVNGITPPTDLIDPDPNNGTAHVFQFELLPNTFLSFGAITDVDGGLIETAPTGLQIAGFSTAGSSDTYFYASNIAYGEVIGGLTFGVPAGENGYLAVYGGYTSSQFLDVGGYIAFTFSTVETGTYHGWAELSLISGPSDNHLRLESYAYANASDGLTVGQKAIPEPSSMASLALGALGLLSWRRSRRPE